ncbi:AAA family ATPase [Dactylosporangium aurantiacum]|uniref:AAA family ATPase n=1 Tax=Dactylosporangium aurantiacum TaxID=35754 RepID=A0A9Q9MRF8_9ACTN|nr:BTAD domain-containing putative transcriptional regulator [Dactylosporangium aurantiacum]MDG6109138.1 BTAD domain-containing putative transcriptional regulator [Dactylosporangium aurantiacum]UWZ58467.1 AAA family ATPase [Dactylosporangium aurantiacum]
MDGGLRIGVLGGVVAERDGVAVDLGGRRQRAVLALLVLGRGAVLTTDRLIGVVWPDEPPPKPQTALQAYVSHLRRLLQPDVPARARTGLIVSRPAGYALQLPPDAVDAWRFERAVADAAAALGEDPGRARSRAEQALSWWRGEPYAEYPGAPWAEAERARLGELHAGARETLLAARLAVEAPAGLIGELSELAVQAPLREQRWRLLATALYRADRQAEALGALRRARDTLRDELGLDPSPALRRLEADILQQNLAPHVRPATELSQPAPAGTGSFGAEVVGARRRVHGRDRELARLREAVAAGRPVLLSGPAGAGKTALLEALTDSAVWGRCPEADGAPPLLPWAEALRGVPGAEAVPELAPLLSDEPGTADADPYRLRRAVAAFLAAQPPPGPLVFDDLHWADRATLDLLVHVAAHAGVPLVAAYRPEAPPAQLTAALARLARLHAEHLRLGPLDPEAVAAIVRDTAPSAPVGIIVRRSDGNPFYAVELARLLGAGEDADAVPAGVSDVVRHRVALLPGPAPTVLKVAAVAGRDLDLDLLVATSGPDEEAVLDAVDAGLLAGLLDADGGRLRFAHALTQEALYAQVTPVRRARWHALIARELQRRGGADPASLAWHYGRAGAGFAGPAADAAAEAARLAEHRGAYADAAVLWRQAATAATTAGRPVAERVARLLTWCGSLVRQGAHAEADAVRAEAIGLARQTGDVRLLARAITAWAVPSLWMHRPYLRRDPAIVAEIEALLAGQALDDEHRCRLLCALISETEDAGPGETAARRALGRDAEALADRLGDPELVGLAAAARLRLTYTGEPLEERERLAARLLATGHELVGRQASAQVAAARGDLAALDAAIAAVEELAERRQLGAGRLTALATRGLQHSLAGRFTDAAASYGELGRAMISAGAHHGEALAFLCRLCLHEASGQDGPALEAQLPRLYEALPAMTREPHAYLLVAAGRTAEARGVWAPERDVPDDFLAQVWHALRITTAVALGAPEAARRSAAVLAPHADQLCGAVTGSMTLAPVAQYLGDAEVLLGRPLEAAEHYRNAARVATRTGAGHYARRARAALDRLESAAP